MNLQVVQQLESSRNPELEDADIVVEFGAPGYQKVKIRGHIDKQNIEKQLHGCIYSTYTQAYRYVYIYIYRYTCFFKQTSNE